MAPDPGASLGHSPAAAVDARRLRLGDFHRLASSLAVPRGESPPRIDVALIGDFSRLWARLGQLPHAASHPRQLVSTDGDVDVTDEDIGVPSDFDLDHVHDSAVTPGTTPPPPRDCHASPPPKPRHADLGPVLLYQLPNGPLVSIIDKLRTREQREASLRLRLVPLRAWDALAAARRADLDTNGIHVFLDMSNINISFQHALRLVYALDDDARFTPLPSLDLGLLTDILVRRRRVVALNAGCSVLPGRPLPRFVHDLRQRGYRVDLRERRPAAVVPPRRPRPRMPAGPSSSDEASAAARVRYVEDMVDETLQTRIGESVMQHFELQGTLVIATGDAQPAKYSDGFFAYAERALKMGWNVEVVSWTSSLSSYWKNPEWMARWESRFRVIELDDFVHDLLANQM